MSKRWNGERGRQGEDRVCAKAQIKSKPVFEGQKGRLGNRLLGGFFVSGFCFVFSYIHAFAFLLGQQGACKEFQ